MKLKKWGASILAAGFFLAIATGAFAQSTDPKEADTKLEIKRAVEVIKEGETVDLEATTQKKGSSYDIEWSVSGLNADGTEYSIDNSTYVLEVGATTLESLPVSEGSDELVNTYVSKATFTGNKAGTYLITATVTMKAGKSHVSWNGSDSEAQKVVAALEVTGLYAKTTFVEEEKNPKGKITGYNVTYDVYVQFADGTEEVFTSGSITNLGASGAPKNVDIQYGDKTYSVTVNK